MQVHLVSKPKEKLTNIVDKSEDQKKTRENEQSLDIAIRETYTSETDDLFTFTPTELDIIYNIVKEKFRENLMEDMFSSYCLNM